MILLEIFINMALLRVTENAVKFKCQSKKPFGKSEGFFGQFYLLFFSFSLFAEGAYTLNDEDDGKNEHCSRKYELEPVAPHCCLVGY